MNKRLINGLAILLTAASIGLSSLGFAQSRDDLIKRVRDKYEESYELRFNVAEDIDFRNAVREDSLYYALSLELISFKDSYRKIIPLRLKWYGNKIREKQESIDSLTTLIELNYDIDEQTDSLINTLKEGVQPTIRERLNQNRDLDKKMLERECILEELAMLRIIMKEKDDLYLKGAFNFVERVIRGKYR